MNTNLQSASFRIGGMSCVNCQNRIEQKLKSTAGVAEAGVDFNTGKAALRYDPSVINLDAIRAAVESLGYQVLGEKARTPAAEIAGTLVIILALYVLLRGLGISAITSAFPLAEAGMGGGMLFVIGLITSVHCIAMCGGINLSQTLGGRNTPPAPASSPASPGPVASASPLPGGQAPKPPLALLFPAILYNGGRFISYTAGGIIVGSLGSVITVSGRFQGFVQLAAGGFMVIMGLNMLGIFQGSIGTFLRRFTPRMPKMFTSKTGGQKAANKSPLIIGLLNGLMPCGPLQAMQLYALSTGSPIAGGISMFLFSMGTVPLMFGIGALSSALSGAKGRVFSRRVMKAGAMLVTVMGMTMFTYGFGLSGFNFNVIDRALAGINPFAAKAAVVEEGAFAPVIENGVQIVNSTLSGGRYPAITVRQGVPVKWTITAPPGSVNGCNNRMIIREYGIEHRFAPGENVIEFTPERTGRFPYSCWMGMIRSSITVVAEGESIASVPEPSLEPVPAGVQIPTDTIALAERAGSFQTAQINLRDDGIDPAIIVLQRGIPALWTITNDSLDPGNRRLIFPAYYTHIDMEQGDNTLQLMPTSDFDFSTADNVFYGYVKVVDDLNAVDIEAIKAEVSAFETLIYPEAYFDAAAQGGSCCAGNGA
jgi:sulfite exporter TauE/SafE